MLTIIKQLIENPYKRLYAGLRSYTTEDLTEVKSFMDKYKIKYKHKTHYDNGLKLPYNGVLHINVRG